MGWVGVRVRLAAIGWVGPSARALVFLYKHRFSNVPGWCGQTGWGAGLHPAALPLLSLVCA